MATRIEAGHFLQTNYGWKANKFIRNDDSSIFDGYKKHGDEIHYVVRSYPDFTEILKSKNIERKGNSLKFGLEPIARLHSGSIEIFDKPTHGILPVTEQNAYVLYYRPTPDGLPQTLKISYIP